MLALTRRARMKTTALPAAIVLVAFVNRRRGYSAGAPFSETGHK